MKKILLLIISIVVTANLSGCWWALVRNVDYTELNKGAISKPENCDIEVFRTALPEKGYTELGVVSVGANYGRHCEYGDQLYEAKRQACLVGGDALVDIRESAAGVCVALTATVAKWN